MKLSLFKTEFPIMLAPMAGFTDMTYRSICREHGCDFTFTEMISAKGLKYGGKSADLMETAPNERPCGIQLFGRDPDIMAEMARRICGENKGELALIDINMGCPAPKITGNGEGSALMREPKLLGEVVRAAEGLVVVGEDVGRVVVARFDLFVEPVQAGAGVVFQHGAVGIFTIGERRTSARVAFLIEAVGEVARNAQRLERRDDQSRSIRKVAPAVDVAVRALVEHDVAAVGGED